MSSSRRRLQRSKIHASVQPINVALNPSAYGWPDATNTGPVAGTTFVNVPSDATSGPGWAWSGVYGAVIVSSDNTVVNGLNVDGSILIDGDYCTVQNCIVTSADENFGCIAARYQTGSDTYFAAHCTVTHCKTQGINGQLAGKSGIRTVFGESLNMTITYNDCSGTGNGITVEQHGLVEHNYIHKLKANPNDHLSGISTHGTNSIGIVVRHNTVLLTDSELASGSGISGSLTAYSDYGDASNVLHENNVLAGGAYVVLGGGRIAQGFNTTNIKIINNRIVNGSWDYPYNSPIAQWESAGVGNECYGNVYDQDNSAVTP